MRAPFASSRGSAPAQSPPTFIGVVHLQPLPGAPRYAGAFEGVLAAARRDADALCAGGCDALIVEAFGDLPFHPGAVDPETGAAMALALDAVRAIAESRPVGVNVLRNDARAALGLCATAAASFLRVDVHTGAAVTDQGLIQGAAAEPCASVRAWHPRPSSSPTCT